MRPCRHFECRVGSSLPRRQGGRRLASPGEDGQEVLLVVGLERRQQPCRHRGIVHQGGPHPAQHAVGAGFFVGESNGNGNRRGFFGAGGVDLREAASRLRQPHPAGDNLGDHPSLGLGAPLRLEQALFQCPAAIRLPGQNLGGVPGAGETAPAGERAQDGQQGQHDKSIHSELSTNREVGNPNELPETSTYSLKYTAGLMRER